MKWLLAILALPALAADINLGRAQDLSWQWRASGVYVASFGAAPATDENLTNGMVGSWKLDDNTNSTAIAGYFGAYNGTSSDNTTNSSTNGVIGRAYYGNNNRHAAFTTVPCNVGSNWAFSAWVKTTAAADSNVKGVFSFGKNDTSKGANFTCDIYSGTLRMSGAYISFAPAYPVYTNNSWQFIAVSVSNDQVSAWINSTRVWTNVPCVTNATYSSYNITATNLLAIGASTTWSPTSGRMAGSIDAVHFWRRPINQSFVDRLYNSGNGVEVGP